MTINIWWTGREIQLLQDLFEEDLSDTEISKRMAATGTTRSASAIKKKRQQIGILRAAPAIPSPNTNEDGSITWTKDECEQMDDAFCAAMEAAGYVKRDPGRTDYDTTVPLRAAPVVHSFGTGWQI